MVKHAKERAFYDLTGEYTIYKYMMTECKITGDGSTGYTMLEYLQKCTGVCNKNGMISKEEIKMMKERLRQNKGNIWHGFISFVVEYVGGFSFAGEERKTVRFTPNLCGLKWLECGISVEYGIVFVRHEEKEGKVETQVRLPTGVTLVK